jgi:alpha-L-fucosidase
MTRRQDEAQHDLINVTDARSSYERTTHQDAQWFPDAGLGLFVHWGLSSVDGNMDLSWGMMAHTPYDLQLFNTNKMRPADYWKLADRFSPEQYEPERWLAAAKRAGCRYAVLTTRHHEGYALWPSEHGDFSTRTHMGGRDLVATFVEACRKLDMKVGLYYSPPDWRYCRDYMSFNYRDGLWYDQWKESNPDRHSVIPPAEAWDENWEPRPPAEPMPEAFEREFAGYVRGQIFELLRNYGQIDIIWFDGNPFKRFMPITVEEIRDAQPGILINPRLHGVVDFETPENQLVAERPAGWWEACLLFNEGADGWGYTANEAYKPTSWFFDMLARHRTWGGNILLNCPPRPDGEMPDTYYRRMDEIAEWMSVHGETLFDVDEGPYPDQCTVPVTIAKDGTWYLHLVGAQSAVVTGKGTPEQAVVHGTGAPVEVQTVGESTFFTLRFKDATPLDDVIAVRW